jgi:manganese/zinc/iron transport system permease protein
MSGEIQLMLVLSVTAVACALPGVYLVLRRMALLSDAIGHVLLFGIVIAFLFTKDLKSPWLILGATLSGLLTVSLIQLLEKSRLVKEDAAIGLVFPAFFSLGVLLISMYTRNAHLDVDAVLLGVPEYAVSRRFEFNDYDLGPTSLVVMAVVLIINLGFILLCYKELKLSTFDAALATTFGFLPGLVHYLLMTLVSLTAVTAFDAVGSVLVVGFMVLPAMTAHLLTHRLSRMLMLSAFFAASGAVLGTMLAFRLTLTTSGTIATVLGLQFAAAFLFAPGRGWVAHLLQHRRQRREFLGTLLLTHLSNHENTPQERTENGVDSIHEHLHWRPGDVAKVARRAMAEGWIEVTEGVYRLRPSGRERIQD